MKIAFCTAVLAICFAALAPLVRADEPKDSPADSPKPAAKEAPDNTARVESFVKRMMKFDKNKDGKLTKDEITDKRLQRLFDRADANHDGVVTKEELTDLAEKMTANGPGEGRRGGFGGGPGGFGGQRGFGGRGGNRSGDGRFAPPRPGQIMPGFLAERLKLTDEQKSQIDALQKDVDAKLGKILTDEQKKQLKDMRGPGAGDRGPGGRGPREGGPDDNGPPPGAPPDGNGPRRRGPPQGGDKPNGF